MYTCAAPGSSGSSNTSSRGGSSIEISDGNTTNHFSGCSSSSISSSTNSRSDINARNKLSNKDFVSDVRNGFRNCFRCGFVAIFSN